MQQGEFGARLKRLRKFRQKSQQQVANKIFVERKVISRYENGGNLPVELADDVLKALDCIYVLGADLSESAYREVVKVASRDRQRRRDEERRKQNEVFKRYREKKEDQ